jgi:hypothetical protein
MNSVLRRISPAAPDRPGITQPRLACCERHFQRDAQPRCSLPGMPSRIPDPIAGAADGASRRRLIVRDPKSDAGFASRGLARQCCCTACAPGLVLRHNSGTARAAGVALNACTYQNQRLATQLPPSRRDPESFLSPGTRRIRKSEGTLSLRPQCADWNIGINACAHRSATANSIDPRWLRSDRRMALRFCTSL